MIPINAAVLSSALCLAVGVLLGVLWGVLTASSHETRSEELSWWSK